LLLLLPWYAYNEVRIFQGAKTNVTMLASQAHHAGRTRVERLQKAAKDLSMYFYLYPLIILTLPLVEKNIRRVVLVLLIPYSLIWAYFFSLYTRNLSIGLALLGLAAGHATAGLIALILKAIDKLRISRLPTIVLIVGLSLTVLGIGFLIPDQSLVNSQVSRQKLALDPEVNQELYSYFEKQGGLQPIFTNYPLRYLPGFEELQVNIGGFEDLDFFYQKLEERPDVRYMLISLYKENDQVLSIIQDQIDLGNYRVVFRLKRYLFVEILQ
jgi:hypothetical protein